MGTLGAAIIYTIYNMPYDMILYYVLNISYKLLYRCRKRAAARMSIVARTAGGACCEVAPPDHWTSRDLKRLTDEIGTPDPN